VAMIYVGAAHADVLADAATLARTGQAPDALDQLGSDMRWLLAGLFGLAFFAGAAGMFLLGEVADMWAWRSDAGLNRGLQALQDQWMARARGKFDSAGRSSNAAARLSLEHGAICYFNAARELAGAQGAVLSDDALYQATAQAAARWDAVQQ